MKMPQRDVTGVRLRTACYARFSSDLQRDTSIDDQVRECREYAKRQGWEWQDSQLYSDKAISGASLEGRTGLQTLQAAALMNPRPFDVLLVDDSSRVARDLADALRVLQAFKFAGVRVVYISQNIDSTSEQAETLVAVHGLVDALYLKEMAAKIKRGLRGQVERGYATGGVTYGYRTVPVPDPSRPGEYLGWRMEIAEAEAAAIRNVFEWYASGTTIPQILARLNADPSRYSAPRAGGASGTWKRGAVLRLLKNERYTGKQIWGQRQSVRRPGSRKVVARAVAREQQVIADRPDLQIISDELWAKAQARRHATRIVNEQRRQAGSNLISGRVGALHGTALFTGVMRCSACGGSISIVNSRTVNGVVYSYYGCYNAHRNGAAGCSNRVTARAEHADPILLSRIQSELTRPETVDYVVGQLTDPLGKLSERTPGQREALVGRREQTKQKVQRLLAALEEGAATATLLPQLQARENELASLESEIQALTAMPVRKRREPKPAWVKRQLADAAELFKHDMPTAKAALTRLGISFTVTPVYDENRGNRPFLRADGATDLTAALFGAHGRLSLPPAP
jgi:site-specific DNA recombinase